MEVVALLARVAGVALVDAGLHVRKALGALHADVAALHVDVTGDVESTPLAEGDLSPGVVDTTEHGESVLGSRWGARSRNVGSEGDLDGLSGLQADGNVGNPLVDGHAVEALGLPAVVDGLVATGVGDLHTPLGVVTDPDTAVVGLLVLADLGANLVGNGGDTSEDILDEVAEGVVVLGLVGLLRGGSG